MLRLPSANAGGAGGALGAAVLVVARLAVGFGLAIGGLVLGIMLPGWPGRWVRGHSGANQ